ncbi:unnamed protein product, partial [Ixodes pacificus]
LRSTTICAKPVYIPARVFFGPLATIRRRQPAITTSLSTMYTRNARVQKRPEQRRSTARSKFPRPSGTGSQENLSELRDVATNVVDARAVPTAKGNSRGPTRSYGQKALEKSASVPRNGFVWRRRLEGASFCANGAALGLNHGRELRRVVSALFRSSSLLVPRIPMGVCVTPRAMHRINVLSVFLGRYVFNLRVGMSDADEEQTASFK